MSTGACLTCGRSGDLEQHHVAGWRNDPDLTVGLCVPCHRLVTSLQNAAGVNLTDGPRTEVDIARATLVGTAHLLEVFFARHPGFSQLPPGTIRVAGRLVSAGLDLSADPDRPGRTTPDSRRRVPTPIHGICHDPAQAMADWARFVSELERILGSGCLEIAARVVRDQIHPASATDIALVVGALAITLGSASVRARGVASEIGEENAALVAFAGLVTLRVWSRLQDTQKGLA